MTTSNETILDDNDLDKIFDLDKYLAIKGLKLKPGASKAESMACFWWAIDMADSELPPTPENNAEYLAIFDFYFSSCGDYMVILDEIVIGG